MQKSNASSEKRKKLRLFCTVFRENNTKRVQKGRNSALTGQEICDKMQTLYSLNFRIRTVSGLKRPSFKKAEQLYQKVSSYVQDEEIQMETEMLARRVEARFLNRRTVVPLFIAAVVLLLAVSVLVVFREHGKEVPQEETSISESSEAPTAAPAELRGNFLLALTNGVNRELRMLAVLQADSVSGELSVFYVPPHTQVFVNNTESSIQRHYAAGGESELVWAVAQAAGTEIDRYLVVTDAALVQIARMFGEHVMTIGEDIEYDADGITYNIEKGEQTLSADLLGKYMDYNCDRLYRGGDAEVTQLLEYFANGLLCSVSESALPQRLTMLFRNLTSNITAMDLAQYASAVPQFTRDAGAMHIENEGIRGARETE